MIYRMRIAAIVLALAAFFVPVPAGWVEHVYWRRLYLSFQPVITTLSNVSPVAFLDIAIVLILVIFLARTARDWRARGARRASLAALARLATTAAVVYLLFLITWGLNYRRIPLEAKLDFDRSRVTQDEAVRLATLAIGRVNAGYASAHAQAFRPDVLEYSFAEVQLLLGSRSTAATGRAKRSLAGFYFRYAAIDGMTAPVFLEVILNPDVLPIERPSVLAHEWAHLAGYADESEANFVAWLAGVRSADPVAEYSAWLDAYSHAVNALPRHAREALPPLDDGPRADLRAIAERQARSSPVVRRAARGVYDSYLKANKIEEGIANYGIVLQLMLGTKFEDRWKPRVVQPTHLK
jgi:hypothetical protein